MHHGTRSRRPSKHFPSFRSGFLLNIFHLFFSFAYVYIFRFFPVLGSGFPVPLPPNTKRVRFPFKTNHTHTHTSLVAMLDSRQQASLDNPESVSVALAAIEWDVALVDNDVRKLLGVMKGKGGETYAGRSSATAEGKAFLQQQIDGLMKEKAQLKEKRTILLQRQQGFQPGGAMADESAGPPAHQQRPASRDKEGDKSPPAAAAAAPAAAPAAAAAAAAPKSPSRRRPASPLGARPSPGAACVLVVLPVAFLSTGWKRSKRAIEGNATAPGGENKNLKRTRRSLGSPYAPPWVGLRHLFLVICRPPPPPAASFMCEKRPHACKPGMDTSPTM